MHNNIVFKKYLRGSSSLEEPEQRPDQSLSVSFLKQKNRLNDLPTDASEPASDNSDQRNGEQ